MTGITIGNYALRHRRKRSKPRFPTPTPGGGGGGGGGTDGKEGDGGTATAASSLSSSVAAPASSVVVVRRGGSGGSDDAIVPVASGVLLSPVEPGSAACGQRKNDIPKVADSFGYYGSLVTRLEKDKEDGRGGPDGDEQDEDGGGEGATTNGEEEVVGPRAAMSKENVAKDENRLRKVLVRVWFGFLMVMAFLFILYSGHVYICALVALCQLLLFRELVKVRYNTYFHIIEQNIPLFRTTQWMWFAVSIFYTYSDFAVEMVIKSNTQLHYLLRYAQWQGPVSFALYSGTFVLTIATMQIGHIRFQLNQLCWTIVVLCLTVGQLKYIMHNVYNGLFWFALPVLLVVVNDIFAYFSGLTCGRKFIRRPFINLSPNKTWEGFIGGWIFTMIFAWHLSRIMARYTWMTCPTNVVTLSPHRLDCVPDPIFHEAQSIFPTQIFELFPSFLVKMVPGVVEICSVTTAAPTEDGDMSSILGTAVTSPLLTNCISGDPTHAHHHFELTVKSVLPVQLHALSLGMFASLVAPFGGFLASGIKRAYGIKDFDSIIPGHGGIMDRMDCQFLMALCTWVHYNTFVKITTVSVPKMLYMYNLMRESEQVEFLEQITKLAQAQRRASK